MTLITDMFPLMMTDMERGVTVNRNLSVLTAQLEIAADTWSLKDGTGEAIFGDGNTAIIGPEDILVGAGDVITRAQNGTPDSLHLSKAIVRLKGGTEIASFAFTGSQTITGIRANGNVPGMYQLKISSDYGPPLFSGGFGQEVFLPFSGIQPENGFTVKVLCWTQQASGVFWAYTHR